MLEKSVLLTLPFPQEAYDEQQISFDTKNEKGQKSHDRRNYNGTLSTDHSVLYS